MPDPKEQARQLQAVRKELERFSKAHIKKPATGEDAWALHQRLTVITSPKK